MPTIYSEGYSAIWEMWDQERQSGYAPHIRAQTHIGGDHPVTAADTDAHPVSATGRSRLAFPHRNASADPHANSFADSYPGTRSHTDNYTYANYHTHAHANTDTVEWEDRFFLNLGRDFHL